MHTRRVIFSLAATLIIAISGCTVKPLYSKAGISEKTVSNTAPNVVIESVDTRVEQLVRNHLIFLLNGGDRQAATAEHSARIRVKSSTSDILLGRNTRGDSDASARQVTLSGELQLFTSDGVLVDKYSRSAIALYDSSTQQFANSRAQIDAQERAATELAETFRAILVSKLPLR